MPFWRWRRHVPPKRRFIIKRLHISEDGICHTHRRENLWSRIYFSVWRNYCVRRLNRCVCVLARALHMLKTSQHTWAGHRTFCLFSFLADREESSHWMCTNELSRFTSLLLLSLLSLLTQCKQNIMRNPALPTVKRGKKDFFNKIEHKRIKYNSPSLATTSQRAFY
jgi:hypothetical protein